MDFYTITLAKRLHHFVIDRFLSAGVIVPLRNYI